MLSRHSICTLGILMAVFSLVGPLTVVLAGTLMTETDHGKAVRVGLNQEVTVTLPSNPTTGYRWEMIEQGAETGVKLVAREFFPSANKDGLIGSGGTEKFRLRLIKAGSWPVTFIYRRPWEKDAEPDRIFRITIESH